MIPSSHAVRLRRGGSAGARRIDSKLLVAMALAAFAAGLAVASFATFRDILPALLEGALLTI